VFLMIISLFILFPFLPFLCLDRTSIGKTSFKEEEEHFYEVEEEAIFCFAAAKYLFAIVYPVYSRVYLTHSLTLTLTLLRF
jgi:hypothetical protein